MKARELIILGSTGSIGTSALAVAQHLGEQLRVRALATWSNVSLLCQQIEQFHPEVVAVGETSLAGEVQSRYPHLDVLTGNKGIAEIAALPGSPLVLCAISGSAGLEPTVRAIKAGNDVALANKEALVAGGAYVTSLVAKYGVRLLPVDSEHSAIFQCLQGIAENEVRRLILTASGGPFRNLAPAEFESITVERALQHPNWSMGNKITIDSSTLMNKGLEVIEAHWLFNIPADAIEVVIHPQSIIHSLVECCDGSLLAQMGLPDMQLPIQYAITYPKRIPSSLKPFDFTRHHNLEFTPPDLTRFKCLSIAYHSLREKASFPCFMNGANEVLVSRFLRGEIGWLAIADGLEQLMARHNAVPVNSLEEIEAVDKEARYRATELSLIKR